MVKVLGILTINLDSDIYFPDLGSGGALTDYKKRWNSQPHWKGDIPYVVDSAFSSEQKQNIREAMSSLESVATCIHFKNIGSLATKPTNYIMFVKDNRGRCDSYIGRQEHTRNVINLDPSLSYCMDPVIIKHEIMHALGFFHEHSRPDRDDHVKMKSNIKDRLKKHNFQKWNSKKGDYQLYSPYDFFSIMHYQLGMKDKDGIQIMEPRNKVLKKWLDPDQHYDMSPSDIMSLNLHFECSMDASVVMDFLQEQQFYNYMEVQQLTIVPTPEAARSYILHPFRIEIESSGVSALYPCIAGEYEKLPDTVINNRPVWANPNGFRLFYGGSRWMIGTENDMNNNRGVARTLIENDKLTLPMEPVFEYYDQTSGSWKDDRELLLINLLEYEFKNRMPSDSQGISIGRRIVISSTGAATWEDGRGASLGEYEYDIEEDFYKQVTTDTDTHVVKHRYLYKDISGSGKWYVGSELDDNRGWFRNTNKAASTVPTSGWEYIYDGDWQDDDPTLTVREGGLTNICGQYLVSATGPAAEKWPKFLGQFSVTDDWLNGRPVYTNSHSQVMYVCRDGTWCIGHDIEFRAIRSINEPMFPDQATDWDFYDRSSWHEADVSVICNKQCNIYIN